MDLAYTPEYEAFRAEVRDFAEQFWKQAAHLEPAERVRNYVDEGVRRGYLYRSIPRKLGGSEQPFDVLKAQIVSEAASEAGASWMLGPQGIGMIVPTLLEVGADWQREKFIPPTLRGDFVWCQGYSEPGAGSDLASLRSSAVLEGDEWVINGHKVWTSDAADADYMFGLFRTEPDEPRHGGISYLLLDMKQPGIEISPLRQITGSTHFYEVFLDNVRTPKDWIVGERGQGWRVTRVNLKHERNFGGSRTRGRFERVVRLAQSVEIDGRPASQDSGIRQRLAEIEGHVRAAETMTLRQVSATANGEEDQVGLSLLVSKLYHTELSEKIVQLAYDLIEADGLLAPTDNSWGAAGSGTHGDLVDGFLFELGTHIAAGTSQIQRNVIGERGLGLPRDLRNP